MLAIRDLHVYYGGIHALNGVSLDVPDGQIISLIGANGAGKSTTLKAIMSLVVKAEGRVYWDDTDITSMKTKDIVNEGIILCPEGRKIFPDLTVEENLSAGAYLRKDKGQRMGLQPVSASEGKNMAAWRDAFGRRAADACGRTRSDEQAETFNAGRTFFGSGAANHQGHFRDYTAD